MNPGIPPASLSWAARMWNWILYGNIYGPTPPTLPPPEEEPSVAVVFPRAANTRGDANVG